jgi:hypothetical protein
MNPLEEVAKQHPPRQPRLEVASKSLKLLMRWHGRRRRPECLRPASHSECVHHKGNALVAKHTTKHRNPTTVLLSQLMPLPPLAALPQLVLPPLIALPMPPLAVADPLL